MAGKARVRLLEGIVPILGVPQKGVTKKKEKGYGKTKEATWV